MKTKKPYSDLQKRRRNMCLDIAEAIRKHYIPPYGQQRWDDDRVALLIGCYIPLTYAEAQAEWDYMEDRASPTQAPGSGIGAQLRQALGVPDNANLMECLKLAIERLRASKPGKDEET